MIKLFLCFFIIFIIVTGCVYSDDGTSIIKVVDFKVSPDENKIVFSALTPIGNTDIWVIGIDGENLKRLTFKSRSPSNHIARFFKRHKWRNFFKINMSSPAWTKEGEIIFCQRLTKHDIWGKHTVSLQYWVINPDGTNKRPKMDNDGITQNHSFKPVNRYKISEYSNKHKKKIYLKDGILWVFAEGNNPPKELIQ